MRPRRRLLLKLGVFVLVGAIVNVAVAWGCALSSETSTVPWKRRPEKLLPLWTVTESDKVFLSEFGWQREYGMMQFELVPSVYAGLGVVRRDFIETIQRPQSPSAGARVHARFSSVGSEIRAGWPQFAMKGFVWSPDYPGGYPKGTPYAEALPPPQFIDKWTKPGAIYLRTTRALPLRVLWPGFAINTIFYAAILWLLLAAPGAMRRSLRRRRGQCPACGYPVGTSAVCSECGKPVKATSVEPVA